MSNPRRTLGLLGVLALTISACSSGGSASSAPASAAPERGRAERRRIRGPVVGRGRARDRSTGGTSPPATPARPTSQAIADAYKAAHPNVKIKITVLENEAFKTKLAATPADAYPDLFQSWGGGTMAAQADAGPAPGHHRRGRPLEGHRQPGCDEHLPVQGRPVRHPVGHGDDRLLVQQGPLPEGRHHAPRRRPGTSTSPPSRSSRRPAWPRSPSRARTSGRRCTSGRTSLLRSGGGDALCQDDPDRRLEHRRLHQRRQGCPGAQRARSVPEGLRQRGLQQRGGARSATARPRWS